LDSGGLASSTSCLWVVLGRIGSTHCVAAC
jgi:hypothetical protein